MTDLRSRASERIRISFVIPALNEENSIGRTISSIERANRTIDGSWEIIVIDHNSRDQTAKVAQELGAHVITRAGGTIASLRNYGAHRATGNVIVFLDADVWLMDEWGHHLAHEIPEILAPWGLITGSHPSPPGGNNTFHKYWFSSLARDRRHTHLGTGHMILSKANFISLGGFDETLTTGEDYEFCQRARNRGCTIRANSSLRTVHEGFPETIGDFIQRERWHGAGDIKRLRHAIHSKVVLGSLLFIALHITSVYGLATLSPTILTGALLGILGLLSLSSLAKNRHEPLGTIAINSLIFYPYYLGRSASLLDKLVKVIRRGAPVGRTE